jgi:uncharacterized protein YhbP (UPF0306 family)
MNGSDAGWDELRRIVAANQYLVLATADANGIPWASPVWFATDDCRTFYWASAPDARHSQNLSDRPEIAITIFDSTQAPGTGEGIYLTASGEAVPEAEIGGAIGVYSAASLAAGLSEWSRADVVAPARLRLYRATAHEQWVLGPRDQRIKVLDVS